MKSLTDLTAFWNNWWNLKQQSISSYVHGRLHFYIWICFSDVMQIWGVLTVKKVTAHWHHYLLSGWLFCLQILKTLEQAFCWLAFPYSQLIPGLRLDHNSTNLMHILGPWYVTNSGKYIKRKISSQKFKNPH